MSSTGPLIDDAPLTKFHKKLTRSSSGGPFIGGFALSIIGVALITLERAMGLSANRDRHGRRGEPDRHRRRRHPRPVAGGADRPPQAADRIVLEQSWSRSPCLRSSPTSRRRSSSRRSLRGQFRRVELAEVWTLKPPSHWPRQPVPRAGVRFVPCESQR